MYKGIFRLRVVLLLGALLVGVILLRTAWVSRDSQKTPGVSYYVAAEELDPIFAIEGTNPTKLRAAVTTLLSQRDQIAKSYPSKEGAVITNTIYPASFLNDLADLEEARQALIASPSVASAKTYHTRLTQTIDDYTASAQALSASLQATAAQYPTIGYLGGLSSTTEVAVRLQTIADAARSQKAKEEARYACLEHMSSGCTPLAELAAARMARLQTPARLPSPGADAYKADALSQKIFPLMPGFRSTEKTIFAISSDCYGASPAYVRAYYLEQVPGEAARNLAGINDAYFYDTSAVLGKNPNSQLEQALVKAGALTKYQSAGNLYMCPDSGLDAASVGSLVGILTALRNLPNPPQEVVRILALPVVQKADLAPYVQESVGTSTAAYNDLAERYIEGSADFDQVLLSAYDENRMFILAAKNEPSAEYAYMLIARNFASALFLLGNPTFVPQQISLFSTTDPNPPQKFLLRSYTHDLSKRFTDKQLVQQTQTAYTIDAKFGF